MKSGTLQELQMQDMDVGKYFGRVLESLASGCQNLEVIKLTNLRNWRAPGISEALENVLRSSYNLKIINCEIDFDLKALRNCKKLESVILKFSPQQPWYDFLKEEDGCLQKLDSLVRFTIINLSYDSSKDLEFTDYIAIILRHCPTLASLGHLESTRALAQLHQTGTLSYVKLRYCVWSDSEFPDENMQEDPDEEQTNPEVIRDAVEYHALVEELFLEVSSLKSIPYLSNLRNLIFLDINLLVKSDYSLLLCKVFKDIGVKLKYLGLWLAVPMDITQLLQHSPNLEALNINLEGCTERLETDIILPKLKYLSLFCFRSDLQVLTHFSNCNNLIELFMQVDGFDDDALDWFLTRNSLSKLKIACFTSCQLSKKGFIRFLRNAPELQHLVSYDSIAEGRIQAALHETNHNANRKGLFLSTADFFH